MTIEYRKHASGDVVELPLDTPYFQQCCDCGLVHRLDTEITDDGRVELTVHRDDTETERVRHLADNRPFITDAKSPAKETFMLDSALEQRVAARRAARKARIAARTAHEIIPDGASVRVPLTLMDKQFVDGLRQKYPPQPIDDARRRQARDPDEDDDGDDGYTQREPEEAKNDAMRIVPTIATYDGFGQLSIDPLELSRPGFRIADRSVNDAAYVAMCTELQDAWKPPEMRDEPLKGIWPAVSDPEVPRH
jgi:hypothetical protein